LQIAVHKSPVIHIFQDILSAMESNQSNSSALRAFRMLECIAQQSDGKTMSALMRDTTLPKQTVHRILEQLLLAGLVVKYPGDRRYQLGRRIEDFAVAALMAGPSQRERHGILQALVDDLGETCNITTLTGSDIVYLDRVEAAWPLRVILAPGSHVPLHATASGKLLLSLLPKPQRERLLSILPMRAVTGKTNTERSKLEQELVRTRRERIGINQEEHLQGLIAVAVPVMLTKEKACAAVAVQAPVGRKSLEDLLGCVPRMRSAAEAIAQTICSDNDYAN
jgi:DNA-binding IclR family transcriptional regulator